MLERPIKAHKRPVRTDLCNNSGLLIYSPAPFIYLLRTPRAYGNNKNMAARYRFEIRNYVFTPIGLNLSKALNY